MAQREESDFDRAMRAAEAAAGGRSATAVPEPPPPPRAAPPPPPRPQAPTARPQAAAPPAPAPAPQQAPTHLHGKLVAILTEIEAQGDRLRPSGSNRHFSYDYWTIDQITGFFRKAFTRYDLVLGLDVESFDVREGKTSKGGHTWLTTILVNFTITDMETGERISGHGVGQGDDPGDKGANKALTGALKYWLLRRFLLGGEDVEDDDRTDRRYDDDDDRGPREVRIEGSNITGIERGGRSTQATDVQVRQVREIARDLEWTAGNVAGLMDEVLGIVVELPEDPRDQGPRLIRALEDLTADQIGKLIAAMAEYRDARGSNDTEPTSTSYDA